jgi:hypothetical protein
MREILKSPKVFEIYSIEELRRIAPDLAMNMYNGYTTNIIINVHTAEFDDTFYKTRKTPKQRGGWNKHTHAIHVSKKGSYHVRSKPENTKELYIVNEKPGNYYYTSPNILGPIYRELGILDGRIIIENIDIKISEDLISITKQFKEISTRHNSQLTNKDVSHEFFIELVVENDKEFSDIIDLLTNLTILRFAPENEKIKIYYTFKINVNNAVNLEGIPIQAGKYIGKLYNHYEFRLENENSQEVPFDYKVPSKGNFPNETKGYYPTNLIHEKVRKALFDRDYIRPDETDKLCAGISKAYTIDTHTFVRDL